MTNKNFPFMNRQGQEQFNNQRRFFIHVRRCVEEACKTVPQKITEGMEWDKLAAVVMKTNWYKNNRTVGGTKFTKWLLDPMMVWMVVGHKHPSGAVRRYFLDHAKDHAPLQFEALSAFFFQFQPGSALQEIRHAIKVVAKEWGLTSKLGELSWFNSTPSDEEIKSFLKKSIGVVGRRKSGRAGEELDDGNEFVIRAPVWQRNWLTGWLLNTLTHQGTTVNGVSMFDHVYDRNPLLAYMVRYYTTQNKKHLKQARALSKLGTEALLFRFAVDDYDIDAAFKAIEKLFLRKARSYRAGFQAVHQSYIEIEDWNASFMVSKVFGSLKIVPDLTHTGVEAHLQTVINNFLTDQLRDYCRRNDLVVPEQTLDPRKEDKSAPKPKAPPVEPDLFEDEVDVEAWNQRLEWLIPSIRYRMAYLLKELWGEVAERWPIPDSWIEDFRKNRKFATAQEVRDLCDQLLITQAELGLDSKGYRQYRDQVKEKLFKVDAASVEKYFREGRKELRKNMGE